MVLNLNQILAAAIPKKQYYYQSRLGNRLFDLDLGPIASAFCIASRPEDKVLIRDLLSKDGRDKFLERYFEAKELKWAYDLIVPKKGKSNEKNI